SPRASSRRTRVTALGSRASRSPARPPVAVRIRRWCVSVFERYPRRMKASKLVDGVTAVEKKLRSRRGTFDVKPLEKKKKLSDAQMRAIEKRIGHPIPVVLRDIYTTVGGALAFRWRFKKGMAKTFNAKGTWGAEPWGALLIDEPQIEEADE